MNQPFYAPFKNPLVKVTFTAISVTIKIFKLFVYLPSLASVTQIIIRTKKKQKYAHEPTQPTKLNRNIVSMELQNHE